MQRHPMRKYLVTVGTVSYHTMHATSFDAAIEALLRFEGATGKVTVAYINTPLPA